MFVGFISLFLLTAVDGESSEKVCAYQDVLNHLNLTKNNELYYMTRPVKDYKQPTKVSLDVLLYAILDVRETDQTFIPYVWVFMSWVNQHISWTPSEFCGINMVSLPSDVLWKPDLTIEEMTEKDKAPPCPLLTIRSNGEVHVQDDQVLVSTCRMHVYKFPFDTQSCTLSFKSVIHTVEEIQLFYNASSSEATEESREVMRTQYEWLFINMTVANKTVDTFGIKQDVIIYTINMKRRPILYIVNFLLPVLFFLCLDLASFLISDSGGEKLSYKVTVLLAVTVLQLILNDILPSSSNRIPLIAVYCIGVFALMMLSLLETILVMYLMEKDNAPQDDQTDKDHKQSQACEDKRDKNKCEGEREWRKCLRVCDTSADETPTELLKVSSSHMMEESCTIQKLSDDLRETLNTLTLLLNSRQEERKTGYWTRKIKTINTVFFIFYVSASSLFLLCMFFHWNGAH
ncbi:5-hydroxytryptamine receptor 3A-like [Solea senegalensis]|uniref:5-hydroxytryptamine receptor 3A-like n=1 Tax=Solea senegalensis TaxID=28829 RepID=A0AAV6RRF1_SOLSE|nr:5-hydroxytryptamine receptor 3A-like isoform X2 [Solea senegalensis]KAG7507925.1 5-hydroxytryptamine receptor 3A-like [Solea senegalensis]